MPAETLLGAIEAAIGAANRDIWANEPARVTAVNGSRVSVRTLVCRPRDPEQDPPRDPCIAIANIQVLRLASTAGAVATRLAVGDFGAVFYADVPLGEVSADGEERNAGPGGQHTAACAFFVPGLLPDTAALSNPAVAAIVEDRDGEALEVEGGEVRVGRGATEKAILGSTYTSAEDAFLVALNTFVGATLAPAPAKAVMVAAITAFRAALPGALTIAARVK